MVVGLIYEHIDAGQVKILIFFLLKKDGGKSIWERSWRVCVERLHGQKSQGNNTGTPVPSRTGILSCFLVFAFAIYSWLIMDCY